MNLSIPRPGPASGIKVRIFCLLILILGLRARGEDSLPFKGNGADERAITFVDVARTSGIDFVHDSAATAEKYLIETMGSGCGWIDFDNDGLLDLYLVNSAGTGAYTPKTPLSSALYRNNGDGTFANVTATAGVAAEGLFGMGVAVGDYDNDGFADLFVAGYGRSILYRNNRDGTFKDVTAESGTSNSGKWASSAAWFDYDRDGDLDLVIANYVKWSPESNVWCGEQKPGFRAYCNPKVYPPQEPTLYRNDGKGAFTDVSRSSGVAARPSYGLGVVTFDYNRDGWQDIFIANDSDANSLFQNKRDGSFQEVAYPSGIAVSEDGKAEAGMGIDAGDVDGDGWLDVFITHLDLEHARLYRNVRGASFEDATFACKLGYATFRYSGFGTRFIDYDNDGRLDIFMANGHILDNIALYHPETDYAEPKLVYRNNGDGTLVNTSQSLGADLQKPRVSRGAAAADFDNDGDLDVLVSNSGGAAELLRNDGGNRAQWLEILLVGTRSNRVGVGCRVRIVAGDRVQFDERKGGMSYQAAQDPRIHFGLGSRTRIDLVEVQWPSGMVTRLKDVAASQILTIQEGAGAVSRAFPRLQGNKGRK